MAPRPIRPASSGASPRPFSGPPRGQGGGPRPPPTPDAINALARKERVPARIAKGELEGKMKCRIWRKLHAEEARRFEQVYELIEKHPGLDLADAFGALQSGLSVEEFLTRKARTQKKAAVKEARGAVPAEAVNAFVDELVRERAELSLVLAERTVIDVITAVEPVAFVLEKTGRLEKLQLVTLTRKALWDKLLPTLERDVKLAQKPLPVARQPDKRPVSDPRPFQELVGKPIGLLLRNGLTLKLPLRMIGPFDLILGEEGEELFVPLHAIAKWE